MKNITLNSAEESYKFGFSVTHDADNHIIKFGTNCNRCGQYFESNYMKVYCEYCEELRV